jgi:hypothetical protein
VAAKLREFGFDEVVESVGGTGNPAVALRVKSSIHGWGSRAWTKAQPSSVPISGAAGTGIRN